MVFSPYKYFGRHWPRQKFTGMIRMDLCCLSAASLKSISEHDILVKFFYNIAIIITITNGKLYYVVYCIPNSR